MLKRVSSALEPFQYTVWNEFSPLALKHQAINLGQGFPTFQPPDFIKQAMVSSVHGNHNQYSRSQGFQPLVEEIARVYGPKYHRTINPLTEVLVTMGASEALLCACISILDPGDEVVLMDPSFDIYIPQIRMAGGVPIAVPMIAPGPGSDQWDIDFEKFEQAFTKQTRLLLLNSPVNPLGKVYSDAELQRIATVLEQWPNVHIVSDEVYEHIVFPGKKLASIATYGDLWKRTATLSSAGKLFSVTGWKTGWAVGGPDIIRKMATAHQWTVFCSNTPCQAAVVTALQEADKPYIGFPTYYSWLLNEYHQKLIRLKDIFARSQVRNMQKIKLRTLEPDGGFFLMAEIDSSVIPKKYLEHATPDFAFCRWLTIEHKISAIPGSAFFTEPNKQLGAKYARFALCKRHDEYDQVAKILN